MEESKDPRRDMKLRMCACVLPHCPRRFYFSQSGVRCRMKVLQKTQGFNSMEIPRVVEDVLFVETVIFESIKVNPSLCQ